MFEILMYLFESYFDAGSYPEPDKLSRKLSAAGFEGEEISEALTWLSALQQQNPENYPASLEHAGSVISPNWSSKCQLKRQFLLFAEQQHLICRWAESHRRAVACWEISRWTSSSVVLMVLWGHQTLDRC